MCVTLALAPTLSTWPPLLASLSFSLMFASLPATASPSAVSATTSAITISISALSLGASTLFPLSALASSSLTARPDLHLGL